MKIRITRGIYGFVKDGNVVEKTKDDPPFEVEDEEGRRLIAINVAEGANIAGKTVDSMTGSVMGETGDDGGVSDPFSIEALENRSKEELGRLAESLGIKKNGSKTELVERISRHVKSHGDDAPADTDDVSPEEDDVPELTAEEPE